MTKAQELQCRQSECRQRLNELLGIETRTAEQTAELEKPAAGIAIVPPARCVPRWRQSGLARSRPPSPHDWLAERQVRTGRKSAQGGHVPAHVQREDPYRRISPPPANNPETCKTKRSTQRNGDGLVHWMVKHCVFIEVNYEFLTVRF